MSDSPVPRRKLRHAGVPQKYDKVSNTYAEVLMGAIERLTITLPAEMAGLVKGAVDDGDYASTSEVIREALRDWKLKREVRLRQLAELKADIDRGLGDVVEGRLANFDAQRIIARGRKLLTARSKSTSPKRRNRT
jgi:antitoxin ParD1/3/4